MLNPHCIKWRHTEVKKKTNGIFKKLVITKKWMNSYNIKLNRQATKTTWEPKDNLKNIIKKVKKYYKKAGQAVGKKCVKNKQIS